MPEGRVNRGHTRFGDVRWAEPVTHQARNTGATEQRVIRIELKKSAPPTGAPSADPLDALIVCRDTQKLIFENEYVRAIEDRGPAGNVAPKHTHRRGVLVALSDFETEATTSPGDNTSRRRYAKGDVVWSDAVTHEVKNVGKTEAYAIRVEVN